MEEEKFLARASWASYIAMAGIWFVLGSFCAWLEWVKPAPSFGKASLAFFAAGALWIVWLRGFVLSIERDVLTYRDGMYRTHTVNLSDITAVKRIWIGWGRQPRTIKIPRLLIKFEGGNGITINTKPFARSALAAFNRRLEAKAP